MKIFIFIFIFFFSLNSFAYKESYNVSGLDDNSVEMIGTLYTNDQSWELRGQLVDEYGNIQDYFGRWNGKNQITGQTEHGNFIDLQVD